MDPELPERYPSLRGRDAQEIVPFFESGVGQSQPAKIVSLGECLTRARMMLRHPGSSALKILGKMKGKILRRLPPGS
jgi:hypothetical protein